MVSSYQAIAAKMRYKTQPEYETGLKYQDPEIQLMKLFSVLIACIQGLQDPIWSQNNKTQNAS